MEQVINTNHDHTQCINNGIDFHGQEEIIKEIEYRDKLLDTTNQVAGILIQSEMDTFEGDMYRCMGMIAKAMVIDRIYIWKNLEIDGKLHCSRRHEWSGGVARPQDEGRADTLSYANDLPNYGEVLSQGSCINSLIRDLPPEEQLLLKPRGALSVFVAPIFLHDKFWGFIGFEDDERERVFSENEQFILRSAGLIISNALLQNDMMQNLHETASRLKAVVSNYPGVICSADRNNNITLFDGLLLPTLLDKEMFFAGQTLEAALQKDEYRHIMGKVFLTFTEGAQDWTFEVNNKVFQMTTTPITDEEGAVTGVVGRIDNVTEKVRLQERLKAALQAAQKASREAWETSQAKSSFLASMSHEIRTPMNAIIGMTQIAAKTDEVDKLKYCLSNIENSSNHLLGLINDILDISKIEAGKLELDHSPLNLEKMLINVCNLNIEKIEQKEIKFNIVLGINMKMHYIGDELRLAQVITNLLSNAVKFTPVGGKIELDARELRMEKNFSVLRFSVKDNGIGMTKSHMDRLFTAYEQAESSTTRKYGGTGLGLTISKSIVEKMDGRIWVESEPGAGSEFIFEAKLECPAQQSGPVIYSSVRPADIKMLIADADKETRDYFKSIVHSFGIVNVDEVDTVADAVEQALMAREAGHPYDIVFVDYTLVSESGVDLVKNSRLIINKDNVVVITTFLNWSRLEGPLVGIGINRFIPKPLFPSSVLDSINEIIGGAAKNIDISAESTSEAPDLSDITLLLAEDVEINREIVFALLEDTKVNIDVAENGLIAIEKFEQNPGKYDMIVMDVQMPEMDGLEATKKIRALDIERAKDIPIIAMTANVFKEDIDQCLEAGMDDHLSKPIMIDAVIEKIMHYCK